MSLITLLTDFGASDYFVGAMKGAILSVEPQAQIVDITHEIPAHDIQAGAFTLLAAYQSFPPQTVHVAVVDPGVGSARRPLLITTREHFFIGPDNGLFSYVCEREAAPPRVYQLTNEKYFRPAVSATFHGRDIFAPVAGALSKGVSPDALGVLIDDQVQLAPLAPARDATGVWSAKVLHIDRFGNLITNITRREFGKEQFAEGARLEIGGREINSLRSFYSEETTAAGELFAVWGSAGFLEIAANCASAAHLLGVARGQPVRLTSRKL